MSKNGYEESEKPVDTKKDHKKDHKNAKNGEDDAYARAQRMLAGFKPGMSLSIYRLRPSWCSGFLERLECFDDEPLDIDYIINEWGGKRLKLRVCDETGKYISGTDLNLSSYPPRFRRKLMNPDDDWLPTNAAVKVPKADRDDSGQTGQTGQTSNQTDVIKLFRELKEILSEGKSEAPAPAPPAQIVNPLNQFLETAAALKKVQGLFGSAPAAAPAIEIEPDSTGEMFGQITSLITALRGNPTAAAAPVKKRIVPDDQPKKQPVADVLASLDAEKYTNILLTSLQKMPENKRETIIANFIQHTGLEGILDADEDDLDDVDDQGEYDGDPEDQQSESARGRVPPNETDD